MSDYNSAAVSRLVMALTDSDRLYDSAQVAFLMATSQRWGYETRAAEENEPDPLSYAAGRDDGYRARVAEENATYPPAPYKLAAGIRIGADQGAARDTAAGDRSQRWAGGDKDSAQAAFMWDADRPDHVPDLRISTRVNVRGGVCTWADA